MNVAINGFGRIGRVISRQIIDSKEIKLVHVNDIIQSVKNIAYLLKYDSTYGKINDKLKISANKVEIKKTKFQYSTQSDISKIKFNSKIDILIDCSGDEKNIIRAKQLIKKNKIKYYIFTMTSSLIEKELIIGLNDNQSLKKNKIFSSSICDANAISHFLNYFNKNYTILSGSVTTLHPWLTYQNLLDGAAKGIDSDPNKYTPKKSKNIHLVENFALGRSSVSSLIPKKTTAVDVCEKIIPSIKNKIISHSFRVPTSVVSCADIILNLKHSEKNIIKKLLSWVSNHKYLSVSEDYCTSKDFEKSNYSAILDKNWVISKNNLIKFVVWYDNEWGYSSRVLDLAKKLINEK